MSIHLEMEVTEEEILKMLNSVDIQRKICEQIKSRVTTDKSMSLVQEEILEDNSIVLTISI